MRPLIILHIERNPEEAQLLERACKAAALSAEFHTVSEAQSAIDYLEGKDRFSDRRRHPLPDLIILDFDVPGLSGSDFLQWLRNQQAFQEIPVLVFTGSAHSEDRARAIERGATGYFTKPVAFGAWITLAESIGSSLNPVRN